jgi:predicted phage baseplate assembly protein
MPLPIPEIDRRSYQEILDELVARIRVHNPEWTNYNESDPGITLLQLFAFMTESLLYRSRLIPERNRLKFLTLLGVPLQPARAAQGIVAFDNLRGPLDPVVLDRDLELLAGKIPFRTENGLAVLPLEARVYRKAPLPPDREEALRAQYEAFFESFQTGATSFVLYETTPVEWPAAGQRVLDLGTETVDGTLWLALLARNRELVEATRTRIAGSVLTLGVVPELTAQGQALPPGGRPARQAGVRLDFHLPRTDEPLPEDPTRRVARYRLLDAVPSTDILAEPGLVQLPLPGAAELRLWEDLDPSEAGVGDFPPAVEGDDQDRIVTWIRVRPSGQGGQGAQASVRLAWVGINAALARQRSHVTREIVARGTGEPDQTFRLANTPVLPETLTLEVDGEPWRRVDDLIDAGPEVQIGEAQRAPVGYGPAGRAVVKAYTVDRESGEGRFGDGLHGARPPAGSVVEASYDHGGGRDGVVAAGAVSKGPALPPGIKVSNPIPTWGGDEPTSVGEAERTIPRFLRHRDRAVSVEDYQDVVAATPGVDMGRVEVLPLFHPQAPDIRSPGVVTVMVIPKHDAAHPDTPTPDRSFLDLVCEHLDPRRLLTTEVHVRGPDYVPVWVSIGFDTLPGRDLAVVRKAVEERVRRFLSALEGGVLETGWPLSTNVERLELWAVATREGDVAKVNDVLLTDETGVATDRVPMSGLRLPRLVAVSAEQGDPRPLADLRGDGPAEPGVATLPVPVDPREC